MRYLGSVKAVSIDREAILSKVKEISEELRRKLPYVKEVRLFGSLARGEEHGLSDVDLLVVVDRLDRESFWKVYREVFEFVTDRLPIDFDLVVISQEDFIRDPKRLGPTLTV